jgi:phosphoribosylformylglycinamidine synthase
MPHPEAYLSIYNHPDWPMKIKNHPKAEEPLTGQIVFNNIVNHIKQNQ